MMGPGTLMGLAWGKRLNDRDYELERARLVRELPKAEEAVLCMRAVKDSALAVLKAVVGELSNEERNSGPRNLSAPDNVVGRNLAFADTADGHLKRPEGPAALCGVHPGKGRPGSIRRPAWLIYSTVESPGTQPCEACHRAAEALCTAHGVHGAA